MNQQHVVHDESSTPFWWNLSERTIDLIRFWLVYSGCLGLLIFRGWDRLVHSDFFAEDVRFVGSAYNEGWATLLVPYDFFFHTAPKLVALLGINLVPVADVPYFTNLACYATTAAAMATVSRSCYRWIIPSDAARCALALLMILAPGLIEILGNLAGLHWSLLLWLAVLSLKEPERSFTVWELLVLILTALSAAGVIVFLPIALLRFVFTWQRCARPGDRPLPVLSRMKGEAGFLCILFAVTAYLLIHFVTRDAQVGIGDIDIVEGFRGVDVLLPRLATLFTAFYFLHPFLGTQQTSVFLDMLLKSQMFYPFVLGASIIVGLLLWRLALRLDRRFWLIPTWLMCLFAFAVMLSIVRYWGFYGLFSPPYWDWWFRYNFVFACTGLVFLFVLLRPENMSKIRQWPIIATTVLIVGYLSQAQAVTAGAKPPHENDAFTIKRYGKKDYWSRTVEELEQSIRTGCPGTVRVVAHPQRRWSFIYESPIASPDCPEEED